METTYEEGTVLARAQGEYRRRKEAERRQWREKAASGMTERKKRSGRFGPAALGYLSVVGEDGWARLEVDPEKGPLVGRLWPLWLERTPGDVEREAERMGLRSMHGIPLTNAAIKLVLRNPVYLGGPHEALVDRATFERVQRKLSRRG